MFASTEEGGDTPLSAVERTPLGGAHPFLLDPTSEVEEPTTAEVDGAFEEGGAQPGQMGKD